MCHRNEIKIDNDHWIFHTFVPLNIFIVAVLRVIVKTEAAFPLCSYHLCL